MNCRRCTYLGAYVIEFRFLQLLMIFLPVQAPIACKLVYRSSVDVGSENYVSAISFEGTVFMVKILLIFID